MEREERRKESLLPLHPGDEATKAGFEFQRNAKLKPNLIFMKRN
jgi:hypothetical protein